MTSQPNLTNPQQIARKRAIAFVWVAVGFLLLGISSEFFKYNRLYAGAILVLFGMAMVANGAICFYELGKEEKKQGDEEI